MSCFIKRLVVGGIVFVSNLFRAGGMRSCRFYPTCSAYAIEAFQRLGFWRACRLSLYRLLKCHPLHHGGVDPLPN